MEVSNHADGLCAFESEMILLYYANMKYFKRA